MNGRFKIKAKGYDVLCFSYIGYDKQEIPIKDRQVINIKMDPAKVVY